MSVSLWQVIAGRQYPGEIILYRVRLRLVDMWRASNSVGVDAVLAVSAVAVVDYCLSQLRAERVNR